MIRPCVPHVENKHTVFPEHDLADEIKRTPFILKTVQEETCERKPIPFSTIYSMISIVTDEPINYFEHLMGFMGSTAS